MNQDERADRLNRIRAAHLASNNRVQDFVELIAEMCATRTRARKARVENALRTTTPVGYDDVNAEQRTDYGRPAGVDERALVCA